MIRAMRLSDCSAVAALESALFTTVLSARDLANRLSQTTFCGFVFERAEAVPDEPALAGYILGQIVGDEVEILSFGVHPDYRRLGYGRRMLGHFLSHAKRRDLSSALLEVAADNKVALALYSAAGFVQTGERPNYYRRRGGRCDALLMACRIDKAFS